MFFLALLEVKVDQRIRFTIIKRWSVNKNRLRLCAVDAKVECEDSAEEESVVCTVTRKFATNSDQSL